VPPSEPNRVFISYACKDGTELAQRLQADLTKSGFDAWLDTQRIQVEAVGRKTSKMRLTKPGTFWLC
jgi:hypothetical protein